MLEKDAAPAAGNRRKRVLYLVFGLSLAATLLYLSLRGIAWVQVRHALASARWRFVALALASCMIALTLRAVRWRVLLLGGCRVSTWSTLVAAAAGYLGNNVLPARAGELIRTLLITRRSGAATAFVLTTVACERVSDAVALVVITAASLLLLPVRPGWLSHAAMPFGVLGCCGLVAIAAAPRLGHPAARVLSLLPIPAAVHKRVAEMIASVASAMQQFHEPGRLFTFAGLTAAIWFVDGVTALLVGASLGLAMTWPIVLLLNAALGLSSAVPSSPGYVGVYQFVAISVLSPFGISNSAALSYIVLAQACSYLVVTVWGTAGLVDFQRSRARATSSISTAPR